VYKRQGSGAEGGALLSNVPVWYEAWRQLNAFPPDFYQNDRYNTKPGEGLKVKASNNVLQESYKLGVTASYPLLNRKAWAGAQLSQLKVIESRNKLADKSRVLQTKALAYGQAITDYTTQIASGDLLANQAAQLLAAEQELFGLGESTQFLLNSRQQALLKAQLNLLKLRFKQEKLMATYQYLLAGK